MLPGKTDAAVDLNGLAGHGFTHVAAIGFGHGDGLTGFGHILINRPGCVIGQRTGVLDLDHHVHALMLDGLKTADRLAELDPLLGVGDRHIELLLAGADHLGTQTGHGLVERPLDNRPARADLAQDLGGGHGHILEGHMALATGHIHRLELGDRHPGRLGIDHKQTDAVLGRCALPGPRHHDNLIRHMRVGHEKLLARQQEILALGRRRQRHAARVIAAALFGQGQAQDGLTGRHAGQDGVLLLVRAAGENGRRSQQGGGQERSGQERAAHLLQDHHHVQKTSPDPAVGFVNQDGRPTLLGHLLPHLGGVGAVVLHHLADEAARALVIEKPAGCVAQHLLFFAETEIHSSSCNRRRLALW